MRRAETVPWAHLLADVTAEGPAFHPSCEFLRDGILQFDGEVTDAAAAIHTVRCDRIRGARINAAPARAAMIGGGRIRFQFQIHDDLAEKEERSRSLPDHVGVLAQPSHTTALRPSLFHHRPAIHEGTHGHCAELLGDVCHQRLHAFAKHLVVIATISVGAQFGCARVLLLRLGEVVVG